MASTTALTEADDGKTIDVASGATVRITLAGNPTTGYQWKVLTVSEALGEPSTDFIPPESLGPGVGGHFVFTWTIDAALAKGGHAIELGYLRHFEKNKPPLRTFRVTLRKP